MSEPKLEGPRNAIEWFQKEYCRDCPKHEACSFFVKMLCIQANILFELVNFFECMSEGEEKAVEEAVKGAERLLQK